MLKEDYEVADLDEQELQQLKKIETEFGYTLVAYHLLTADDQQEEPE